MTKIMWSDADRLLERGDMIYLRGIGALRIMNVTQRGASVRLMSTVEVLCFVVRRALAWGR